MKTSHECLLCRKEINTKSQFGTPAIRWSPRSWALFELLLEGLDQPDKLLAQNCLYALAALGASIIPHLRQLAGEVSTGRMFRQRLTVAIALIIETTERGEALNHSWIQTAVFDALRPNNPQLNQRAMSALQYLPTSILDGLITLAVVNSNNTDYCLRLLCWLLASTKGTYPARVWYRWSTATI